jgi:hypothetical protein
MRKLVIAVIIAMATIGLVSTMAESVEAWHSTFGSKEDCVDWFTKAEDMKKSEARDECEKELEH